MQCWFNLTWSTSQLIVADGTDDTLTVTPIITNNVNAIDTGNCDCLYLKCDTPF